MNISSPGAASPNPFSSSASAASAICAAVFALETNSGRMRAGTPSTQRKMTPPTISRSRNTTRMASQSGSTPIAASVT